MADTFYGVAGPNATGNASAVTAQASTNSTSVELRVTDSTTGLTKDKNALLLALKSIENYIRQNNAPA